VPPSHETLKRPPLENFGAMKAMSRPVNDFWTYAPAEDAAMYEPPTVSANV
jgi:hypothetical protein